MFFNNIITFLKGGLPFYTNLFEDNVNIINITFTGVYAEIITDLSHQLKVGDYCIIKNVEYLYVINNITYNNTTGILTGNIGNNHQVYKNQEFVNIVGDYIGKVQLLELDNDNNIKLCLPTNLVINNLSISKILDKYINNYFRVDNVIDSLTFRVLYTLDNTTQITQGGSVVYNSRVDGGYNVANYIQKYLMHHSKIQDYIYVEYNNFNASRSKSSETDYSESMQTYTKQWKTRSDNITIYYISNTTNESSKVNFIDRASREVRNALLKVLQNNSEVDTDNNYSMTIEGGSISAINESQSNFSVFEYNFYLIFQISDKLLYNKVLTRRIKDININCNFIPYITNKECN